jgi:hypothetical protein
MRREFQLSEPLFIKLFLLSKYEELIPQVMQGIVAANCISVIMWHELSSN